MRASVSTRARITHISLNLFNEQGERNVSTNHIAVAADISPGNLYYHFANKQQIVALLVGQYQARVHSALTPPPEDVSGIERLRICLDGVIAALWEYRFIYRDLEHLVQADPALAMAHRSFSIDCLRNARVLLEELCANELLAMTAQAQQALAINAWLILTSWVRYLYTTSPAPVVITAAAVRRGAWQALNLLQGFVTPKAASSMAALMESFRNGKAPEPLEQARAHTPGTSA